MSHPGGTAHEGKLSHASLFEQPPARNELVALAPPSSEEEVQEVRDSVGRRAAGEG